MALLDKTFRTALWLVPVFSSRLNTAVGNKTNLNHVYMWGDAKLGGKANCNTFLLDRFVCSPGKCRGGKYKRIETHLRVVDTRLVARPIATHMLTRMCHGSIVKNRWNNNPPIKENTCKMSMSVVHLLLIKTFGTAMSARMCAWLEDA